MLICVSPVSSSSGTNSACPNHSVIVTSLVEAIARIGDNETSAQIVLLPGLHPLDAIQLSSNVSYHIQGLPTSDSDQQSVFLQPASNDSGFSLIQGRSSGVIFSNFAVFANTSGSVFLISESRNVMFDHIYLLDIASQSTPVLIRNSLDVRLVDCKFLGSETPAPKEGNHRVGLSVLFEDFPGLPSRPSDDASGIALSVLGCHFSNFTAFFPSFTEIVTAHTVKLTMAAVDIHFMGSSTSCLTVAINDTTFDNIEVPLFSPVHVMFSNGASNNTVLATETNFTNCIGKTGGAILIDFNNGAIDNTVSVANSSFFEASAFIGGGTVDGRYINASRNEILFQSCCFVNVSTAEVFLEGAVLFFYSNLPSPMFDSKAVFPYHVIIRNCQFKKDITSEGVIVAKNVRILLEGLK